MRCVRGGRSGVAGSLDTRGRAGWGKGCGSEGPAVAWGRAGRGQRSDGAVGRGGASPIGGWPGRSMAFHATLALHGNCVCALVIRGDYLMSTSRGGTIRLWEVGTWAALRTVPT